MNAPNLSGLVAANAGNRAIDLLARTTHAMRADPAFVVRDDDVASAAFLAEEEPAGLAADALNRVLAEIDAGADADERAHAALAEQAHADELEALPPPVREAALD